VAEREGFEPSIRFHVFTFSRRAPSASRPSLQIKNILSNKAYETSLLRFAILARLQAASYIRVAGAQRENALHFLDPLRPSASRPSLQIKLIFLQPVIRAIYGAHPSGRLRRSKSAVLQICRPSLQEILSFQRFNFHFFSHI
jgi:hypothetical protein